MFRNSFKFLTLALAAAITVAPVSALDWNSGSTHAGLGIAVIGLAYVAYKYWFGAKSAPILTEKQQDLLYNGIRNVKVKASMDFEKDPQAFNQECTEILHKINREDLNCYAYQYRQANIELERLKLNNKAGCEQNKVKKQKYMDTCLWHIKFILKRV